MTRRRASRRFAALVTAAASLAAATVGLAGYAKAAPPSAAAPTRPPQVVASVYALAQLASYIGGKAVRVVDLAPPGAQPQGLPVTAAIKEAIQHAALVIDVGDGYQPQVEAAATRAHRVLSVLPGVSKQPRPYEFWLDPYLMAKAATLIARELSATDPAAKREFENGSRNFQSVASSIESDFESTFTNCTRNEFVTSDGAFQRLATSFDLVDVAVDVAGVGKATTVVRQYSLPAVFSEVGVPSGLLQQVAQATGATVKTLDPLELAPPPGGPAPLSYFSAMEYDLTALEGPLACDTTGNYF